MREFHLGIIGGCMSHQPGIAFSQLYHRRLGKMFEREDVHLHVSIARRFTSSYTARLDDLLTKGRISGVMLQLRTLDLTRKTELLSSYFDRQYKHYILHPFLFKRRNLGWTELESGGFPGSHKLFTRKPIQPSDTIAYLESFETAHPLKAGLIELNLFAGILLGIHHWAIRSELKMLAQFKKKCDAFDIPFFVLGPIPLKNSWAGNYLWNKFNRACKEQLQLMRILYCLIDQKYDEAGNSLFKPDGTHISEKGHAFVARQLHQPMIAWIKNMPQETRVSHPHTLKAFE